jgi:hypothetical protein
MGKILDHHKLNKRHSLFSFLFKNLREMNKFDVYKKTALVQEHENELKKINEDHRART